MKVIIDGDQMIYACGFASEGEPLSHTLRLLKNKLEQIMSDCQTNEYELFIEGKGNFREAVSLDYKGNRTARKPLAFNDCIDYLKREWGAVQVEGMETDDMVSILLWNDYIKNGKDKATIILSSVDKDLLNTPGWHYNPNTRDKRWISERQAERHFWFQMLAGDRVDNVTGLPRCSRQTIERLGLTRASLKGVGRGTATTIIQSTKTIDKTREEVIRCYAEWAHEEAKGVNEFIDYLTEQGQLLHMTREVDEYGDPVLWQPPFPAMELEAIYNRCKGEEGEASDAYPETPEQETRAEEEGVAG